MNEKTHKETSGIDKVFNNFIKDFLSEMSHHDIMDNDQVILVPTQQTAAYLRLKIAEQGIYAGTRIITAQDLISEIRCNSIKENNLDALLYGDPWSKENLTWRILQVFNNYADEFPDNFKYWIGADKTSQESTDEETSLDIDQDTYRLIVSDVAAELFDWIFDKVPQGKRFIRIIISEKTSKFKAIERNLSDLEASFAEIITDSVCNNFPRTITALDISSALKQNKNKLSSCIQQYQITGPELTNDERKKLEDYENEHKIWEEKIAQGKKETEPKPGAKARQAIKLESKNKELSQQFQTELIEAFNTAFNKIDTPEAIDFLTKAISSARTRFTTEGLSTSTVDYRKRKARRLTLAQTTAENYLRYLDQMPELLLELPNDQISQWQITLWKKLLQLNPEYGDPAQFITSFGVTKNINASIKRLPKSIFVYGFLFYSQSELNLISGLKNSNIKVKEYQLSDSGNLGPKLENWMPSENKINKSYSLPQTTLHKCIGINRQVQVIQDLVVKLVNSQEENINPEEILILTPELDTLFPLLSFAFEHDNQRKYNSETDHPSKHIKLWFSHETRNDQSSETNQYLLTLFSLLDGPVNFQDIAKLFSLQGVLNAAGLSYDDGQDLIVLMQDAQAAWGWDYNSQLRSEILPNRTGTIEYVLRCIASAISVDTKEAICWDSNDSDTSVYTPKISSSITVSVAAKAIQYLERLRNLVCSINPKESYKAIDLTIDNWSTFLQESLDDVFFKPAIVDEKKARAIARKWLDKTGQI
ncbi:MAG: exodeoxyribonuclease V subunit gamma, partial [Mogibacterium sp.]|nr:exodeoxyribonuclease V subunit gamma [Mogibacterium sp.]